MNITTFVGILLAWASFLGSVILEGGKLSHYVLLPPFVLVMGGTLGATLTCFSLKEFLEMPVKLGKVFFTPKFNEHELIHNLLEYATRSRRDGILALENDIEKMTEPFMKKGFQMVVDGTDAERVRETMENEITTIKTWYKEGEEFMKVLGGFSPTLGVIGTVAGLIHMLGNLSDADSMGPAIASAFIATMYGVGFANLLYLPLAGKLKNVGTGEVLKRRIILEGLMTIQMGLSPRIMEQVLLSYIHSHKAPKASKEAKEK